MSAPAPFGNKRSNFDLSALPPGLTSPKAPTRRLANRSLSSVEISISEHQPSSVTPADVDVAMPPLETQRSQSAHALEASARLLDAAKMSVKDYTKTPVEQPHSPRLTPISFARRIEPLQFDRSESEWADFLFRMKYCSGKNAD